MVDAVVIGSGPNGLVAANVLADAGWSVTVLEAQPEPGGAVRSAELTEPGFRHDVFSSFYPLGAGSPAITALDLEAHGLHWCRHPLPLAHPARDGSCAILSQDPAETAASLDGFAPGDGAAWERFTELWERIGDRILEALATPFPPVRAGAGMLAALGPSGLEEFVRLGLVPVRRLAEEEFTGNGGGRLLAGNALHADLAPESPGSAMYGFVLAGLGQQVGFPVAEGGSGSLTAALVRRLRARGGRLECGAEVCEVVIRRQRAVGVRTADGRDLSARRAILADVGAPELFTRLVGLDHVPARVRDGIRRFEYGNSTIKLSYALSGPVPWTARDAQRAGTFHLAEGMDALSQQAVDLAKGLLPGEPFLIAGQYALADPSRQPPGAETLYAYTHVPQRPRGDAGGAGLTGDWHDRGQRERFADRMEDQIEALAPGFRDLVRDRHVMAPQDLQARNQNLVGGAINGGTAMLHQQLVLRPVPGLGRPETAVRGLYLASASAHPGGGVHGACGANAARAALRARWRGRRAIGLGGAAAAGAVAARRFAR